MLTKGHKIIDVKKLNYFLRRIIPRVDLTDFEVYSIANCLAREEKRFLKEEEK